MPNDSTSMATRTSSKVVPWVNWRWLRAFTRMPLLVGWPSGRQSALKDALQWGMIFFENRLKRRMVGMAAFSRTGNLGRDTRMPLLVGWPSGRQSALKDALQWGMIFFENRLKRRMVGMAAFSRTGNLGRLRLASQGHRDTVSVCTSRVTQFETPGPGSDGRQPPEGAKDKVCVIGKVRRG